MKAILFLIYVLNINFVFCQNIDIKWGDIENYSKNSTVPAFLGTNDDNLYYLHGINNRMLSDYSIAVYSKNSVSKLQTISFTKTMFPETHDCNLLSVYYSHSSENFLLFIQSTAKKGETAIYLNILDSKWNVVKEKISIFEYNIANALDISIQHHPNNQTFLISGNNSKKKPEKISLKMQVINEKGEVLNKKQLLIPNPTASIQITHTYYEGQGRIFFLIYKKNHFNDKFFIPAAFIYTFEDDVFSEMVIPFGSDGFITSYAFSDLSADTITLVGHYSDKPFAPIKGLFYLKFNATTYSIYSFVKYPFNTQKISGNAKPLFLQGSSLPLFFQISEVHQTHPDTVQVITEFNYDYKFAAHFTYRMHHYRKQILSYKLDLNGNIVSITVIPQGQKLKLVEKYFIFLVPVSNERKNEKLKQVLSYQAIVKDNATYFLYNDHPANMKITNFAHPRLTKFKSNTALILARLDKEGNLERKFIFKKSDNSFVLGTANCVEISDDELLLYAISRSTGKFKIGILKLEE